MVILRKFRMKWPKSSSLTTITQRRKCENVFYKKGGEKTHPSLVGEMIAALEREKNINYS